MPERTADDLWNWLATCRTCGSAHQQREIEHNMAGNPVKFSWEDPEDGHSYRPRLAAGIVSALREEWVDSDV